MDLRVKPNTEAEGLDVPQHGEEAYGQEFEFANSFSYEENPAAKNPRDNPRDNH
jgi:Amt family ammonium transporter